MVDPASLDRFTGFADMYDSNRPAPPASLGPLLCSYANELRPKVVDLGSGTGLSTRWAANWSASVIGVEPNDEMRMTAESRSIRGVEYRPGTSDSTGLASRSADLVTVVQAMHWMEPDPTLREICRVLRPGGVLAVIDADWPPVSGVAPAEQAWVQLHRLIRVFEARLAAGSPLDEPVSDDDPALANDDLADPHLNRVLPGGLRSWSKSEHLSRMKASGHFPFTRELALNESVPGGAERFVALMRSQGSYQGLRKRGLTDDEIGATEFERTVRTAFDAARVATQLSFTWRVRLGVTR